MLINHSEATNSTDWTFAGTWPFAPQYFKTPQGRMHYVDVGHGSGKPIVMVHGNPTWGYVWRKFISALSEAGYRCIVPDHLGFGRSDKPFARSNYRYSNHCTRLEALLDSLDLRDVTLILQDWGGPIAAYWASRNIERLKNIVALNTLMHPVHEEIKLHGFLKMVRTFGLGEFLVLFKNATVEEFLFHRATTHPERFDENMKAAYRAPFPTVFSRRAVLEFPRAIATRPTDEVSTILANAHETLLRLHSDQVLILWPMKDLGFRPYMIEEYWLRDYPKAQVVRVEDSGHYIQEDAPQVIIPEIIKFLRERYGKA